MITAGEVIKKKRESLGKNLNTVSIDTKIQKRFLEYIENNRFDKFDSSVFATGFLKIYAKYLELDVEKILALYRRSTLPRLKTTKQTIQTKKKKNLKINISPKLIAIITLVLFVLLILGYVGYQIYKFQVPPELTVTQPTNEYISNQETITVKGYTQASSVVSINNEDVEIDEEGFFEQEISLTPGVNTLTIKAQKESNTNLETTQSLKVIYEPTEEVIEVETKEFLLTLSISQSPSWIKLDIDNENKIEQVVQPNTISEYKVEEKFSLVTGRVQNTQLQVNGEDIPLTSSATTGIGQITCLIVDNELECE
jgi:cytoskeletal protein RodZ